MCCVYDKNHFEYHSTCNTDLQVTSVDAKVIKHVGGGGGGGGGGRGGV